jgi:hypothetical protein
MRVFFFSSPDAAFALAFLSLEKKSLSGKTAAFQKHFALKDIP